MIGRDFPTKALATLGPIRVNLRDAKAIYASNVWIIRHSPWLKKSTLMHKSSLWPHPSPRRTKAALGWVAKQTAVNFHLPSWHIEGSIGRCRCWMVSFSIKNSPAKISVSSQVAAVHKKVLAPMNLENWQLCFATPPAESMGKSPTQLASVPTTASSGKLGESKGVKELASWPRDLTMGQFSSSYPQDFKKNIIIRISATKWTKGINARKLHSDWHKEFWIRIQGVPLINSCNGCD